MKTFKIKINISSLIKFFINKNNNLLIFQKDENIISTVILNQITLNVLKNSIILESNNLNNLKIQSKLINQNILGLIQGFKIKLNLIGIGYKYFIKLNKIYFKLNKSHLICFKIPNSLKIYQINANTLLLNSYNFQELTNFIKKLKIIIKPNIYKKKGLFFYNENIKIKKKK